MHTDLLDFFTYVKSFVIVSKNTVLLMFFLFLIIPEYIITGYLILCVLCMTDYFLFYFHRGEITAQTRTMSETNSTSSRSSSLSSEQENIRPPMQRMTPISPPISPQGNSRTHLYTLTLKNTYNGIKIGVWYIDILKINYFTLTLLLRLIYCQEVT